MAFLHEDRGNGVEKKWPKWAKKEVFGHFLEQKPYDSAVVALKGRGQ